MEVVDGAGGVFGLPGDADRAEQQLEQLWSLAAESVPEAKNPESQHQCVVRDRSLGDSMYDGGRGRWHVRLWSAGAEHLRHVEERRGTGTGVLQYGPVGVQGVSADR